MIEDDLNIWFEDQIIGYLWRDELGHMDFKYDKEWDKFPLSISLPLHRPINSQAAHRFFANLLPEGFARDRLCARFRCPNTDFDLLREIGSECAGALSILPVEKAPDLNQSYEKINPEDLQKIIKTRGASLSYTHKPRLSLAGAQDKITVSVQNHEIYLPINQTPSTHILKFEVRDFKNVPLYEVYTTWLAKIIGLNTIDIELGFIANASYTLSKRYDRTIYNNLVSRTHQEDFCQALGYKEKYQRAETPNFSQCYQLIIEHSSNPLFDADQLIKWHLFNLIAGNSDAHIKNISFLYAHNEIRLAPFYDLVCTRAIRHLDETLALRIGNQKNPNLISKNNLIELANQCKIRPNRILNIANKMIIDIDTKLALVNDSITIKYGKKPALQQIDRVITQQIKLLKHAL